MGQFYISNNNEDDVQRCNAACCRPILITGLELDGQQVKAFRGIVQFIDDDPKRSQGRRYKVTILDRLSSAGINSAT